MMMILSKTILWKLLIENGSCFDRKDEYNYLNYNKKEINKMFSSFRHHTSQQGTSCLPQTDSFQKLPATIGSNVIVMEFFFLLCVVRTTPISTNEKSMKSALPSDNILPTMYKKSTSITFDGFSFFKAFFKFSLT